MTEPGHLSEERGTMVTSENPDDVDGCTGRGAADAASPLGDLQIEYMEVGRIAPYSRELRRHSERKLERLKQSVIAFGMVAPVIVNEGGVLLNGHALVEAAKRAGHTRVPVVRVEHLDAPKQRALRLTLNKLAEDATWSDANLAIEFKELLAFDLAGEISFDLEVTGFGSAERDRLIELVDGSATSADDEVAAIDHEGPQVSRLGDLWVLGDHRILCGNSREADTFARLLDGERAAMGIHDPPYDLAARFISKRHGRFVEGSGELGAGFAAFLCEFLTASTTVLVPGATTFMFMDWRHMGEVLEAGKGAGLQLINLICWDKGRGGQGSLYRSRHELAFVFKDPSAPGINNVQLGRHGRNRTNVWEYPGSASMKKELALHPTPKSVPMVADAIRDVSDRGDLVLDAFSGSGTTIIAAAKVGRRTRVIDLDPHYVDVAVRRWERWSGEEARHGETGLTFAETSSEREEAVPPQPAVRVRKRAA
jgi:DNA modification methylase